MVEGLVVEGLVDCVKSLKMRRRVSEDTFVYCGFRHLSHKSFMIGTLRCSLEIIKVISNVMLKIYLNDNE